MLLCSSSKRTPLVRFSEGLHDLALHLDLVKELRRKHHRSACLAVAWLFIQLRFHYHRLALGRELVRGVAPPEDLGVRVLSGVGVAAPPPLAPARKAATSAGGRYIALRFPAVMARVV